MSRSPIEMMVDKACGFDPEAPRAAEQATEEVSALLMVADAALAWWRNPGDKEADALRMACERLDALGWSDIGTKSAQ